MIGSAPDCIECGETAFLVKGADIPNKKKRRTLPYWLCKCGAYTGCHRGTLAPLGYPGNHETRAARTRAHLAFDTIWENGWMHRFGAYSWLARQLKTNVEWCHFAMMSKAQADHCTSLILRKFPQIVFHMKQTRRRATSPVDKRGAVR